MLNEITSPSTSLVTTITIVSLRGNEVSEVISALQI